ncbi:MAG: hypothetical protein ABIQ89_01065 [Candidatus Saccharimonadales bacterium]
MFFQKISKSHSNNKAASLRNKQYNDLIREEAKIGGRLFGPIPQGHRREFFCLDEHTWVWYEEWVGPTGQRQSATTRYNVRPNGIIKTQEGRASQYVGLQEARNLHQAVELYNQRIDAEYGIS